FNKNFNKNFDKNFENSIFNLCTAPISHLVSPYMHNVGIMLPYSGTHFVLFEALSKDIESLVMTSANLPGRPMVIDNSSAYEKLKGIADGFLVDDRIIVNRTDDTVIRFVNSSPLFLRRSRGFVPERILLPFSSETGVAGVGAEMNNTVSFSKNGNVFISQYIGNTKHVLTNEYHAETLENLKNLTGISPELWVCDMHPAFNTTETARLKAEITKSDSISKTLLSVQHHHAHICSCMADNMLPLDSSVLGVALDGVGYGPDGTVWGGEILKCTYTDFERLAHFKPQPMPGADAATYFPARMAYGCLFDLMNGIDNLDKLVSCDSLYFKYGDVEKKAVLSLLKNNENIVKTSSAGRIFDSVSAVLGLCDTRTYDGEPAMRLESAAYLGRFYGNPDYGILKPEFISNEGNLMFDTSDFLLSIFNLFSEKNKNGFSVYEIAAMVEFCISDAVCELVNFAKEKTGINQVVLSGGVFNNNFISTSIFESLKKNGFSVFAHKNLPAGDGCISHGQVAIGTANVLLNKI
ncbi:MAG: carbamoyltransferase HypF, partial [Methanosarcinaceae archaeon]|nr:carbamoyltransferase HypF [Methanosarcinaceae archaeon]